MSGASWFYLHYMTDLFKRSLVMGKKPSEAQELRSRIDSLEKQVLKEQQRYRELEMTNEKYGYEMTDIIYTTLKQIRAHSPCEDGYKKLCKYLGGIKKYGEDTPITFKQIYDSNGYADTIWCLRAVDEKWYPLWRHFACDCADDVRHLMTDARSIVAIDTARSYADGLATDKELDAARDAAWAAAWAAAGAAAVAAARAAAGAAAWAAAGDAAVAGDAAARAAARGKQIQRLFEYCRTGERVK